MAGRVTGWLGCAVSVVSLVFMVWGPVTPARAGVPRIAVLTPMAGHPMFSAIATAAGVVVAGGESGVEVFSRSRSGWRSGRATAVLAGAATAGTRPDSGLGTDGEAVVATEANVSGTPEAVWVRPRRGWSGTVAPAATLTAPSGNGLEYAVMSGSEIVAVGGDGAVYVFTEPARGWSGTVRAAARLVDSAGPGFADVPAIAGRQVFVPSSGRGIDVFDEPAAGWSGVLRQSSVITGQWMPLLVSGSDELGQTDTTDVSDFGPVGVFAEGPRGWSGPLRLVAPLQQSSALDDSGPDAFSGSVAAISSQDDASSQSPCPCEAEISVFTRPARGWARRPAARSEFVTTETGGLALALDGHTLFVTGDDDVDVYQVTAATRRAKTGRG